MANNGSIYWNPIMETMPREKAQRTSGQKSLNVYFEWAYKNSPFYQKLYKDAGIEPGDIQTYDDIKRVPKINKDMLRDVQKRPPFPYGDILAVALTEVTEFRQTSGTTGTPVYQADTWQDWEWWAECWAYILYAQGYRDTDRFFLPFGYISLLPSGQPTMLERR